MNKHVLILTRSLDHQLGGMEIHTLEIIRFLAAHNWIVTVLTPENKSVHYSEVTSNVNIIRIAPQPNHLLKYSFSFWINCRRYVKKHAHLYDAIISISMAGAFIETTPNTALPPITSIIHGTYGTEKNALQYRFLKNLKDIVALCGIPYCILMQYVQKRMVKKATHIVAISNNVATALKKECPESINKINIIKNFIDTEEFFFTKRDFNKEKLNCIYVGRLHREKGLDIFFNAAKYIPNIIVDIYGNGPMENELQQMVLSESLPIHMHGPILHSEVRDVLAQSDIFIFPSRRISEGLPLSILEAMSSGCIVISADLPATQDVIKDDVNGLIFKKDDVDDLIRKIISCLQNREMLATLSEKARRTVLTSFDKNTNLKLLLDILER